MEPTEDSLNNEQIIELKQILEDSLEKSTKEEILKFFEEYLEYNKEESKRNKYYKTKYDFIKSTYDYLREAPRNEKSVRSIISSRIKQFKNCDCDAKKPPQTSPEQVNIINTLKNFEIGINTPFPSSGLDNYSGRPKELC